VKKIGHIIRKELIELKRDPRMLFMLIAAPVVQLLLLGYAANLDVKNIPIMFADLDASAESRQFISQFVHSGYFNLRRVIGRLDDINAAIDRGEAALAVVIPEHLGRDLARRETVPVQIIVDGSESQSAIIALSYATQIAQSYSRKIRLERLERLAPGLTLSRVNPQVRVWYNPDLKSRNYLVPGVLGLLLMVTTMVLTSLAIVKEKEMGTLEQLIVTPIRSRELILGKLTPFFGIGLLDIALVVLVATLWFRIPMKGSPLLFAALSPLFLLTTLGLGLFTSTISRNQQQAMMTAVFSTMPMILLSGFVFPIANMPRIIQYVTYLIPLRYYLVIIRGLFLKGADFGDLWPSSLSLLIFGVAILALSVLRFHKKIE
jgi:ABC-2 type transport system permease protein